LRRPRALVDPLDHDVRELSASAVLQGLVAQRSRFERT
jgi:hypothetical protein